LGHTRYVTRLPQYAHLAEGDEHYTGMTPADPATREILAKLLEETMRVFDGPYVHVGLDEANIGQHPATKQALLDRGRAAVVADHVRFLHSIVTARGRRMMMWADDVLGEGTEGQRHDRALAPLLPRDIVMCNWQYAPEVPAETTQWLLDQGFDVVVCP